MDTAKRLSHLSLSSVLLTFAVNSNGGVLFEELTESTGFDYIGETFGASWGNLNSDPFPDLFVSNHRNRPIIYLNNGNGTFTDVTSDVDTSGIWTTQANADTHGASWADYDNDRDQDLYVSAGSFATNQFLVNEGGFLIDQTSDMDPLYPSWRARMPVWFDPSRNGSNDGLLDLIMASENEVFAFEQLDLSAAFLNVTADAGVACDTSQAMSLADVNADDQLELICWDDSLPTRVYQTSTFPFNDITNIVPATYNVQDVAIGDFNNDLVEDFFLVRGNKRLSGAARVAPQEVEAQIINGRPTQDKGVSFVSSGDIEIFLAVNEQLTQSMVHIGAEGVHPTAPIINKREMSFTLDSGDPSNVGIQPHDSSTDDGIYIGFDPGTETWEAWVSSGALWRYWYMSVNSNSPVSDVTSMNLSDIDFPLASRLLLSKAASFVDRTAESGLSGEQSCISAVAGDFDNDMDVDLYVVCRGAIENLANILYENLGDGTFAEHDDAWGASGNVGFDVGKSESVVLADFDVDGFLDFFVTNGLQMVPGPPHDIGGPYSLFHNLGNNNHWVEFDLTGEISNRDGIGAKVYLTAGGITQLREQNGGYHRWSQNHQRIHFGLGDHSAIDEVKVVWPSGNMETFTGLWIDTVHTLIEGTGNSGSPTPECGTPSFRRATESGVFLYNDCGTDDWHIRVTAGWQKLSYLGTLTSSPDFISMTAFSFERNDQLPPNFVMNVGGAGQDGLDFTIDPTANVCLDLTGPAGMTITAGSNRIDEGSTVSLPDFGPCPQ